MMISPEGYYSMELEGASEAEVRTKIRGLKQEIGRLKNLLESRSPDCISFAIRPSPETQLHCTREYLKIAKKTLTDMGAEYILSKNEKKVEQFQKNLNYLSKITWKMAGYFGDGSIHTVEVKENNLLYSAKKGCGGMNPDYWDDFAEYTTEQMESVPNTKTELLAELEPFWIGEWKKRYNEPWVCDGLCWNITFEFSSEIPAVDFNGYHKTPYNFYSLHQRIFGENYCH